MGERFDAIIIGSGQTGKPLGLALAEAGWRTAIVERELVGGTCINVGCTPTKTMVASARVAYLARRAADYGVATGEVGVDIARVVARKRNLVERFRNYGTQRLQQTKNLELIFGAARFADPATVEVALRGGGSRKLTATKIVVNTGGRPAIPPVAGLADAPYLDSSSVMELAELPRHLLVLGGGYIGLEFAQMFRRFGAEVTVLEGLPRLAAREDEDVSDALRRILEQDGIKVETGARVERVAQAASGEIAVRFSRDGAERTVQGSHLLVATGRRPNTDDLNLAAAGVAVDRAGYIGVDPTLATNVPGIFAAGDVKGGPAFTHIAYDDFRILRDRWLRGIDARVGDRPVPNVVFIDPQLATVGLNETQARERGLEFRVARLGMNGVARALEMDESRGFIKVLVDRSEQILGCVVLGIEGGEIMSMLQIAMMGKLPYPVLKEAIFAHPTLAEGLNNVFLALDR